MLLIAPIDDVNRAIRAALQIHGDVAWVGGEHEVGATVHRFISRSGTVVDLVIHLMPVQIMRKQMPLIRFRPVGTLIDHGSDMRMPAINCRGAGLARTTLAAVIKRGGRQVVF